MHYPLDYGVDKVVGLNSIKSFFWKLLGLDFRVFGRVVGFFGKESRITDDLE